MRDAKLDEQMDRFIKSGFKLSRFTNDLYEMLYIDSGRFIAHVERVNFHFRRFHIDADITIQALNSVNNSKCKVLCKKLAAAMEKSLRTEIIETKIQTVVKK